MLITHVDDEILVFIATLEISALLPLTHSSTLTMSACQVLPSMLMSYYFQKSLILK